jgi:hypothetical protein
MNELPREARWSLLAAITVGLFLAGLGAGAVVGRQTASAVSGGNGVALWATNSGTGVGAYGGESGSQLGDGPYVGVAGQASSQDGIGIYGANLTGGQAGYFDGSVTITHDLQVDGAVTGYSALLADNASPQPLRRGDAVALLGVRDGPNGAERLLVGPAQKGQVAIGIVDREVQVAGLILPGATVTANGTWQISGIDAGSIVPVDVTADPGASLLVATSGPFGTASVSAGQGAIDIGTPLAVGDTPGRLVAAGASPAAGTILGYALGKVTSGTGLIPVLIQPR